MRSSITQEDAGLLALITKAHTGVDVVAEAQAPAVLAENTDLEDPNDHDINAISALHAAAACEAAHHLMKEHTGATSILLDQLHRERDAHLANYKEHAAKGTQPFEVHADMANNMKHDMHVDLGRHLKLHD